MTIIAREQQLSRFMLQEAPNNLRDPMNGGIRHAVETRVEGESSAEFKQRLYGDSYELHRSIEAMHMHLREIVSGRGIHRVSEQAVSVLSGEAEEQVMWCMSPQTMIDADGKLQIDYESMMKRLSEPDELFGTSVLPYQHWLLLGFEFDLEVRVLPTPGAPLIKRPMLEAVPQIPSNTQAVAVVPNPLLYVPNLDNIAELEAVIGSSLQERFRPI